MKYSWSCSEELISALNARVAGVFHQHLPLRTSIKFTSQVGITHFMVPGLYSLLLLELGHGA